MYAISSFLRMAARCVISMSGLDKGSIGSHAAILSQEGTEDVRAIHGNGDRDI